MRVVVDARKAADFGIGTYIRRLGEACSRLAPSDEFVFLGAAGPAAAGGDATDPAAANGAPPLRGANVTWTTNASPNYGLTELISVSRQVGKLGGDVFHAPHYVYPLLLPCPGVVTIHDCIHLRFPGQLPNPVASIYARLMIRRAVSRADRVLTVSEATRADLVELVDADPSRIEVIPHGCDPYFLEQVEEQEIAEVARKHGLERPFLLSVTNIKPHKNLRRLLEAFAQLGRDDLDLVIAGGTLQAHPELGAVIDEAGIQSQVRSLGFVPKAELRALYHGALIFVFPSLYEGFGLPPLEAMACGTAVVASRAAAIPEVVGHSGLLVNPYRIDAITEAIRSLLENSSYRQALAAQGRMRAREFDWESCARRVLEVYRQVAGS